MRLNILPEYLQLIKDGKKKIEFRDTLYTDTNEFTLFNIETNKVEAVITIMEVIDTKDFPEEEKESILDDAFVTEEFREQYDCRYAYLIEKVENVH